ncbi:MAG TPA: ribonuclease HI family protein [Acidobacteriaceae bacterium]|nr:ribonuclease HI family protein [Acidobacteriaceae bacterium]
MSFAQKPQEPRLFPSSAADWTTAYCDGGSRGNPGPAGFGVHIEGSGGKVLAELSEYLGVKTNNFAEYSGLIAALRCAVEKGYSRLRIISDSELMVKQMKGQYRVKSPDLLPLYEQAKSLARRLDSFEISHVLRGKNRDADRLANEAMDRGMGRKSERTSERASESGSDRGPDSNDQSRQGEARPVSGSAKTPEVRREERPTAGAKPITLQSNTQPAGAGETKPGTMLRGFTRGGVIHLLGSELPDGVFVKVIPE